MSIESQHEQMLIELIAHWHLMAASLELADWNSLQACAEMVMNDARRLELLVIQEQQET